MKIFLTILFTAFVVNVVSAQWVGSSPGPIYYNGGNVGIGTGPSPASRLYLTGGGRNGLMIDGTLDGTASTKYLSLWQGAGGTALDPIGTGILYLGYDQPTDVRFGGASSGWNGVWQANGKVGIGTTAPAYQLDVSGAGEFVVFSPTFNTVEVPLILKNASGNQGAGTQINFQTFGATAYINSIVEGPNWNSGSALSFGTPSSGTIGTERMRISSAGNVGIGSISPSSLLEIGSATTRGTVNILSSTDNVAAINLTDQRSGGHQYTLYGGVSGAGNLDIYDQTASDDRFMIKSNGFIGIGTASPDAKLAVAGTVHAQEVDVNMTGWSDYVLKPTYKLPKLKEVQDYIDAKGHLPDMPSENEVVANGIHLTEMLKLQQKKIEELTLYIIEQNERIEKLEGKNNHKN